MEVSNLLDSLARFLRNPRTAPNLGMYPRLVELLAAFLRNPRIAPNLGMYPKLLEIEGCDQREHFEDEHVACIQNFWKSKVATKENILKKSI